MDLSGQLHDPTALPPVENSVPIDRRLGGHQRRAEWFGEENNILNLPGLKPRIAYPVT